MLDEVIVPLPGENPSAEGRMAAIVHGFGVRDNEPTAPESCRNPSAEGFPATEIREERGVYRLRAVAT